MKKNVIDVMERCAIVVETQRQLIDLLYSQVMDLSMMSKIELGDDVISEINRLKTALNESEE